MHRIIHDGGKDVVLPSLEQCEEWLKARGYRFRKTTKDLCANAEDARMQIWVKKNKKEEIIAQIVEVFD